MKLRAAPGCAGTSPPRRPWVTDVPFCVAKDVLQGARRTIVRFHLVFRGRSSHLTFALLPNSLFFNWNYVCIHRNAKSLFDKWKPVDRGLERTYSGAKWQKVGQSGLDFDGNRCSQAAEPVAGN
jgi:hypothetical protein